MIEDRLVSSVAWARARWYRWPLLLALAVIAAVVIAALVLEPRRRPSKPIADHLDAAAARAEAAARQLEDDCEADIAEVEALVRAARAHEAAEAAAQACDDASGVYAYEVDLDDRTGLTDDLPRCPECGFSGAIASWPGPFARWCPACKRRVPHARP